MTARLVILPLCLVLTACDSPLLARLRPAETPAAAAAPGDGPLSAIPSATLDPDPPPPPAADAVTVEALDTTTDEDRADALASSAGGIALGTTQATLGAPADPGIWLKTPLVAELAPGRISYQGTSINVELRPLGGDAGAGSQLSLAAMRLIGAPLTDIVELSVFRD